MNSDNDLPHQYIRATGQGGRRASGRTRRRRPRTLDGGGHQRLRGAAGCDTRLAVGPPSTGPLRPPTAEYSPRCWPARGPPHRARDSVCTQCSSNPPGLAEEVNPRQPGCIPHPADLGRHTPRRLTLPHLPPSERRRWGCCSPKVSPFSRVRSLLALLHPKTRHTFGA